GQRPSATGPRRSGSGQTVGLPADAAQWRAGRSGNRNRRELYIESVSTGSVSGQEKNQLAGERNENDCAITALVALVAPGNNGQLRSAFDVEPDGKPREGGRHSAVHHVGLLNRRH